MMNLFYIKKACLWTSLFICLTACKQTSEYQVLEEDSLEKLEQLYKEDLETASMKIGVLENLTDLDSIKTNYLEARKSFKQIEPILGFQDINNYNSLNAPNILKVDEEDQTDVKIKSPTSYQTLEEAIYADVVDINRIQQVARSIRQRIDLVLSSIDLSHYEPYHVLWLVRKQIVRTALTGVTGFDSPILESSLDDAVIAFAKAEQILYLYRNSFNDKNLTKHWEIAFKNAENRLKSSNFNDFDRYLFLQEDIDPMLQLWTQTAADWQVKFPLELAMKNDATSLFSNKLLSLDFYADREVEPLSKTRIELGKKLFNDVRLSTTKAVSCASCHMADLAFSDGQVISMGQLRNSPSLTYTAYQQDFFYDKRAGSLEGQIVSVINSSTEFHSDLDQFTAVVENDTAYKKLFGTSNGRKISESEVRQSIADYVRSLNDWDSKWDRNMRKEERSLTVSEIKGFNLFSGKAKCATCHFAPVFNGTVPPDFSETELEHLGVPSTNVTKNAMIDKDLGRYDVYKTDNRRHFFKTPSLRNVALTAPYMHNGVYKTLADVVDFYNRGGGAGIGIKEQEHQTLPPDELGLTEQEQEDLVNFMKSLTDLKFESQQTATALHQDR